MYQFVFFEEFFVFNLNVLLWYRGLVYVLDIFFMFFYEEMKRVLNFLKEIDVLVD